MEMSEEDRAAGWISRFLEFLTISEGVSPHTVRAYASDLEEFFVFLKVFVTLIYCV